MKRLVFITFLLLPVIAFAQAPIQVSSPYQYNKYVKVLDSLVSKNIIIPRVVAFPTPKQTGQIVNKQDTVCFWNGSAWIRIRKVTWPEDSVRYASKSGVSSDTAKLHNQIITKLNASDTARYISKSQARKDIHDSIAPLRADVENLKQLTDTTSELVDRTIYVSKYQGNDTTGNGLTMNTSFRTIFKAFTTIKQYILSGITIQIDTGSYSIGDKELNLLKSKRTVGINSAAFLGLKGTTVSYMNGLTGSIDAVDKFKFNITSPTLSNDALKFCYLSNGSSFRVIYENTSNTISTGAWNSSFYNSIYRCRTFLTFNRYSLVSNTDVFLRYDYLDITIPTQFNMLSLKGIQFNTCIIRGDLIPIQFLNANSGMYILHCYFYTTGSNNFLNGITSSVTSSVFESTSNANVLGINGSIKFLSGSVFKNFRRISGPSGYISMQSRDHAIKFINMTNVVSNYADGTSFSASLDASFTKMFLENCTNLIDLENAGRVNFKVKELYGTYANLFNPLSDKILVNTEKSISISIPGTYPEYQQNQSTTLANNSTDSISIANISYNRSINIDYTITRNGQYRTGSMKVLNTGSTYLFDPGDYIESADVGVTFQGVFKSGNSNTLKLKWTTTNTGQNAIIQCDYRRQNF